MSMSESLPKHKFLPPPGRTLFILGQANDLIRERWLAELDQDFWLIAGPELRSTLGYSNYE